MSLFYDHCLLWITHIDPLPQSSLAARVSSTQCMCPGLCPESHAKLPALDHWPLRPALPAGAESFSPSPKVNWAKPARRRWWWSPRKGNVWRTLHRLATLLSCCTDSHPMRFGPFLSNRSLFSSDNKGLIHLLTYVAAFCRQLESSEEADKRRSFHGHSFRGYFRSVSWALAFYDAQP